MGCLPQEFRKTVSSSIANGMTQSCSGCFMISNHKVNFLSLRFMSPESSKNNTAGLAQCPSDLAKGFLAWASKLDIYPGLGLPRAS